MYLQTQLYKHTFANILQLVAGSLGESLGLQRTPEAIAAITAARDAHMPAPGTVASASDVAAATDAVTAALESTLDLHLLSTLLELTKGQRLLARGMFVLHPQVSQAYNCSTLRKCGYKPCSLISLQQHLLFSATR
jgi:hypothetical protein